jgi:hypothetical protein
MWDEIVLAILSEARHGRAHWSLDRLWAPVEAGRALNVGDVEAGRLLPPELVVHRFGSVRQALIAAIDEVPDVEWTGGLAFRHDGEEPQTLSGLCQFASTPEADPARTRTCRLACLHLGIDAD